MEQNLTDRERKQRLIAGTVMWIGASLAAFVNEIVISAVLGIAGLGFFFNYFTCFCGTKKALKSLTGKNSESRHRKSS